MIVHIVLFKWKNNVSKKQVQETFSDLENLKGKIKGLEGIFSGENFSKYSEGFEHGLVVLAKGAESLDAYRKHPLHLEIAKKIERLEEKSIGVDFET